MNKTRILQYFFDNPITRLRVREIEREAKAPLPSVIRYVRELEQEGLLRKIQISSVTFYSADRSSPLFLTQKKLDNLRKIYASGLIEHINQHLSNPAMILFGSYSRGEDIETSDIDIYLETEAQKTLNLKTFEKELGRQIHLHIFKNLTKIPSRELRNNIINGIPLSGFVEVFR